MFDISNMRSILKKSEINALWKVELGVKDRAYYTLFKRITRIDK